MRWARRVIRSGSCPSSPSWSRRDVPVGAVAGAGGLDVGGLLAGLPAASEDDGAIDGRALLAVDVLGVGEPQGLEVLAGEPDVRGLSRRVRG